MSTSPSQHQQQALFLPSKHGNFVLKKTVIPSPGEGQLLIKIKSAALNLVDWAIQNIGIFIENYPAILGSDLAGDIVEVGQNVTKFKPGDRVLTQARFNNEYAAFQEYTLADEYHLAKIPENLTYDEAATLPLTLSTAYIGLFNESPHGAFAPNLATAPGANSGTPIVISGGATSVGQSVIQLAKVAGFSPIIATASLKHTNCLESLGATAVLDRSLPFASLKEEIEKITTTPVKLVYDAVSDAQTQQIGHDILAPNGTLVLVLPESLKKSEDKTIVFVLALRDMPSNIKILTEVYEKLTEWLENGTIKPNRVEVLPGGLGGIVDGLSRLGQRQVSSVKLVVHPEETVAQCVNSICRMYCTIYGETK